MRILFISLECASGTLFSGNGVLSRALTQSLVELGHDVLVLCACPDDHAALIAADADGSNDSGAATVVEAGGVKTLLVPVPRAQWRRLDMGCAWRAFADGAVGRHARAVAAHGAQVVFGVDWSSACAHRALVACGALPPTTAAPLVYLVYRVFHCNEPITEAEIAFYTSVEREMCERASCAVALCARDRANLLAICPSLQISIIPPPLRRDVQIIAERCDIGNAPRRRDLIVCCCRLSPEKNVELFVRLMCHPRVVAVMADRGLTPCLIGASIDADYTSRLTAPLLAAHPRALLHDFMPVEQLSVFFLRCALYVHPPLNESFGMTIIEAAAFGAPALINANGIGAGELLEHGRDALKLDYSSAADAAAFETRVVDAFVAELQDERRLTAIGARARDVALQMSEKQTAARLVDSVRRDLGWDTASLSPDACRQGLESTAEAAATLTPAVASSNPAASSSAHMLAGRDFLVPPLVTAAAAPFASDQRFDFYRVDAAIDSTALRSVLADAVAEAFSTNALEVALGLSAEQVRVESGAWVASGCDSRLTVIAVHRASRQCAGAALCDDFADDFTGEDEQAVSADSAEAGDHGGHGGERGATCEADAEAARAKLLGDEILRIVHHVESRGRAHLFNNLEPSSSVAGQSPPRGRILHLDLLAVRPSFAGAGLGTALIAKALEVARQTGFRSACCSVSNVRTMHIVTSKFGFEKLPICVEYADWRVANAASNGSTSESASSTPFANVSQRFPGEAMRFAYLAQL